MIYHIDFLSSTHNYYPNKRSRNSIARKSLIKIVFIIIIRTIYFDNQKRNNRLHAERVER